MDKPLLKLVANLDSQVKKHKILLNVLKKKLNAIVAQDWEKLQVYVERSNPILEQIRRLEEDRVRIVWSITGDGKTRISELTSGMKADERKALQEKADELTEIVGEVKSAIFQISTLLETSLEVIDYTVSLLSGNGISGSLYGTGGREKKSAENNYPLLLNIKA